MAKTSNYQVSYFRESAYTKAARSGKDIPLIHTTVTANSVEEAKSLASTPGRILVSVIKRGRGRQAPLEETISFESASNHLIAADTEEATREESTLPSAESAEPTETPSEQIDEAGEESAQGPTLRSYVLHTSWEAIRPEETEDEEAEDEAQDAEDEEEPTPEEVADLVEMAEIDAKLAEDAAYLDAVVASVLFRKEAELKELEAKLLEISETVREKDETLLEISEHMNTLIDVVEVRSEVQGILESEVAELPDVELLSDKEALALRDLRTEGLALYQEEREASEEASWIDELTYDIDILKRFQAYRKAQVETEGQGGTDSEEGEETYGDPLVAREDEADADEDAPDYEDTDDYGYDEDADDEIRIPLSSSLMFLTCVLLAIAGIFLSLFSPHPPTRFEAAILYSIVGFCFLTDLVREIRTIIRENQR